MDTPSRSNPSNDYQQTRDIYRRDQRQGDGHQPGYQPANKIGEPATPKMSSSSLTSSSSSSSLDNISPGATGNQFTLTIKYCLFNPFLAYVCFIEKVKLL